MMRSLCVLAPILVLVSVASPAAEKPFGLDRRIPWNDSRVAGSPEPPLPYKVARAFPKLTVKQPLSLTPEPGTNRLLRSSTPQFLGRPGPPARRRRRSGSDARRDPARHRRPRRRRGLPPRLPTQRLPLYRTERPTCGAGRRPRSCATRSTSGRRDVSTRTRSSSSSSGPPTATTAATLPLATTAIFTSPRGTAPSDSDAKLTGQTIDDLLAAVLRIDVDHPDPGRNYGVPKDNPFVDRKGARPELWAYGLRNPWRLSYDRESGQLWVGQNGQDLWEQVYLIKKGANYGWSITEGSHIFQAKRQAGPDPIAPPTAEHPHSEARSLTGGRVYRGTRLPELVGAYVYGDWSTGRVWGIKHDGTKVIWHRELVDTPFNITGFGTDHAGELYVIDQASGFYRLEPTTEADRPSQPFPTRLSQTGPVCLGRRPQATPGRTRL